MIPEEERKKLRCLKKGMTDQVDVVMIRYATAFDEEGKPVFFYYRERIVKKDGRFFWQGRVHEAIVPEGNVFYADACIFHRKNRPSDADRNLRIYENMLRAQEILGPREQFYYGRELYYHEKMAGGCEGVRNLPAWKKTVFWKTGSMPAGCWRPAGGIWAI